MQKVPQLRIAINLVEPRRRHFIRLNRERRWRAPPTRLRSGKPRSPKRSWPSSSSLFVSQVPTFPVMDRRHPGPIVTAPANGQAGDHTKSCRLSGTIVTTLVPYLPSLIYHSCLHRLQVPNPSWVNITIVPPHRHRVIRPGSFLFCCIILSSPPTI
jgi:hypothetical protein